MNVLYVEVIKPPIYFISEFNELIKCNDYHRNVHQRVNKKVHF